MDLTNSNQFFMLNAILQTISINNSALRIFFTFIPLFEDDGRYKLKIPVIYLFIYF